MHSGSQTTKPEFTPMLDEQRRIRHGHIAISILFIPTGLILTIGAAGIFASGRLPDWWEALQFLAISFPLFLPTLPVVPVFKTAMNHLRGWPFIAISVVVGLVWSLLTGCSIYLGLHFVDSYVYRTVTLASRALGDSFFNAERSSLPQTQPKIDGFELLTVCLVLSFLLIPTCVFSSRFFLKSKSGPAGPNP
jgi:hypothetical protein